MSGPSRDRTLSICVIKAENSDEARNIMKGDPLHRAWQSAEVIEWEIHAGAPSDWSGQAKDVR